MRTKEEQIDALLEDLNKAEEAGLMKCREAHVDGILLYDIDSIADITGSKHRILSKYLRTTYPDVDVMINSGGGDHHIQFDTRC